VGAARRRASRRRVSCCRHARAVSHNTRRERSSAQPKGRTRAPAWRAAARGLAPTRPRQPGRRLHKKGEGHPNNESAQPIRKPTPPASPATQRASAAQCACAALASRGSRGAAAFGHQAQGCSGTRPLPTASTPHLQPPPRRSSGAAAMSFPAGAGRGVTGTWRCAAGGVYRPPAGLCAEGRAAQCDLTRCIHLRCGRHAPRKPWSVMMRSARVRCQADTTGVISRSITSLMELP
jgi:hypothetical protein